MNSPKLLKILTFIVICRESFGDGVNRSNEDEEKEYTGATRRNHEGGELDKKESLRMEGKVVGGNYTLIEDFPHAACIIVSCRGDTWICGSSILNQNLIITAAHCVHSCRTIMAHAGSTDYTKAQIKRGVQRHIAHREYDPKTLYADIALCCTKHSFPLSQTISRAFIAQTFPSISDGFTAGWGVVNEKRDSTNRLKTVFQSVRSLGYCRSVTSMYPGTYCAGSGSKSSYPLFGDSGSAHINRKKQIIGLVSSRSNDIEITVYTNVSFYYKWIKAKGPMLYCYKGKK